MTDTRSILVTGGAGFIGSALCRYLIEHTQHRVINLDALTYAASPASTAMLVNHPRYHFIRGDITDRVAIDAVFAIEKPDIVMHLAAESHVDRSIDGPAAFIQTNIIGTYNLLEASRQYYSGLSAEGKAQFRFHHISTDEVFGSLGATGLFREDTPYDPSSPYSASKAASDHLVMAWGRTYGLPVVLSNCSNNYGPYHFPEKLIPLMIIRALHGESLPVYGDGQQIRDWLFVEDHVRGLHLVATQGKLGESYNIGGNQEMTNMAVVHGICDLLDVLSPETATAGGHRRLITHVADRPGHDRRYAIDASHIKATLGWEPAHDFANGLRKTVEWYLENRNWWQAILAERDATARIGTTTETKKENAA